MITLQTELMHVNSSVSDFWSVWCLPGKWNLVLTDVKVDSQQGRQDQTSTLRKGSCEQHLEDHLKPFSFVAHVPYFSLNSSRLQHNYSISLFPFFPPKLPIYSSLLSCKFMPTFP